MLTDVFYIIVNMSIMASFIIGIIVIIRKLGRKWFSQKILVLFWVFVLVRLTIPIALPSELSIVKLLDGRVGKTIELETKPDVSFLNVIQLANEYEPLSYKDSTIEGVLEIFSIVWCVGVIIMLLFMIASKFYLHHRINLGRANSTSIVEKVLRKYQKELNLNRKVRLFQSSYIKSPIVVGVCRPKIVLPYKMENHLLDMVMIHELMHIKRQDNFMKQLFSCVLCLHWFNPLVWYMVGQIHEDIEMACDEAVLTLLTKEQMKEYGLSLIEVNENNTSFVTGFSNTRLERRIHHIVNYKKMTKSMIIVLSLFYLVVAVILLTNK